MTRTPVGYFEEMYGRGEDPWGFATRWYEQRKYALTLASLPRRRYRRAFEPGCSIGVLTEQLARRCDLVVAADLLPAPVAAARVRTAGLPGVSVHQLSLPEQWPDGEFDLLVLSEIAYYFDEHELGALMRTAVATLSPGATVVAVHWRGETDYPLHGDDANRVIGATTGLRRLVTHEEDEFALAVWTT